MHHMHMGDNVVVISSTTTTPRSSPEATAPTPFGGKAYWSSPVYGNHNGFCKMEESYHTTIQASPRMTAPPMPVEQSAK